MNLEHSRQMVFFIEFVMLLYRVKVLQEILEKQVRVDLEVLQVIGVMGDLVEVVDKVVSVVVVLLDNQEIRDFLVEELAVVEVVEEQVEVIMEILMMQILII